MSELINLAAILGLFGAYSLIIYQVFQEREEFKEKREKLQAEIDKAIKNWENRN